MTDPHGVIDAKVRYAFVKSYAAYKTAIRMGASEAEAESARNKVLLRGFAAIPDHEADAILKEFGLSDA
ncbi:hypothetical protein IIA15_02195 [candidate division TA06 bacterium]|nr:hypothetical protein [candidate division TA06 bacterium]